MLKTVVYWFEYLLTIYFAVQGSHFLDLSLVQSLLGFSLIMSLKYLTEGWRFNFILLFISQFLLFIHSGLIMTVIAVGITVFSIIYFPIYHYPKPKGIYKVGYKRLVIDGLTTAVFYPTFEETTDVRYHPCDDHWVRFYEVMKYDELPRKYMPKYFYKFALSFMSHLKLEVNLDARIKKERTQETFPVIIFSGGLSANQHVYVVSLKEWASRGFICIAIDHVESIYYPAESYDAMRKFMLPNIKIRQDDINSVMNFIYREQNIHDLFEDQDVFLDYSKIFACGHSVGGGVLAEMAMQDKRFSGGMFLIDPWMIAVDWDLMKTQFNRPLMLLKTGTYQSKPDERKSIADFMRGKRNSMLLYYEKAMHNVMTDLCLHLPREFIIFGMLESTDDIEEFLTLATTLSSKFLEKAAFNSRGSKRGQIAANAYENFKDEYKRLRLENPLKDGVL